MSSKAYRLLIYVSIDAYCKIYVLEIKGNYNRGAVVATDGRRIEAMSHGKIKLQDKAIEDISLDDDELIV